VTKHAGQAAKQRRVSQPDTPIRNFVHDPRIKLFADSVESAKRKADDKSHRPFLFFYTRELI